MYKGICRHPQGGYVPETRFSSAEEVRSFLVECSDDLLHIETIVFQWRVAHDGLDPSIVDDIDLVLGDLDALATAAEASDADDPTPGKIATALDEPRPSDEGKIATPEVAAAPQKRRRRKGRIATLEAVSRDERAKKALIFLWRCRYLSGYGATTHSYMYPSSATIITPPIHHSRLSPEAYQRMIRRDVVRLNNLVKRGFAPPSWKYLGDRGKAFACTEALESAKTFHLNLSCYVEEKARQKPSWLVQRFRKHLAEALGEAPPFLYYMEFTRKHERLHLHGVIEVIDGNLPAIESALKKAGGERYDGPGEQLVMDDVTYPEGAVSYARKSFKRTERQLGSNAIFHMNHKMTSIGEAHWNSIYKIRPIPLT